METIKIAWSDKRKNQIVNFYALEAPAGGSPLVLTMPFSVATTEDVRVQLNAERVRKGQKEYDGPILHVCLDLSSGRMYLPNMESPKEIELDDKQRNMLAAVKLQATRLVGPLPLAPVIRGDPLTTIRCRTVEDFPSVAAFIRKQIGNAPDAMRAHMDLPVVEADLSKMPATVRRLPKGIAQKQAAYIGPKLCSHVDFYYNDLETTGGVFVLSQKTPFILINLSEDAGVSAADKERLVVTMHREFSADVGGTQTSGQVEELRAIKYLMYIGWSMKDLCLWMLKPDSVTDFRDLMFKGSYIWNAAKSLAADGYPDPSGKPYYYSMRLSGNFPIRFAPNMHGQPVEQRGQPDMFRVLYYDSSKNIITIRTPLYITDDLAMKVFNASEVLMTAQYEGETKELAVESPIHALVQESPTTMSVVKGDVSASNRVGTDVRLREKNSMDAVFERKKISDYPQAADVIKSICQRVTSEQKRVEFNDLPVIIGPWMAANGMRGGYCDARTIEAAGMKVPVEPVEGFFVYPPCILIDNEAKLNVADRTNVIIHEYRHHINSILWISDPRKRTEQVDKERNKDDVQGFLAYLSDPNERLSHLAQFKYMIGTGMSREEILLEMFDGRRPTAAEIPIARKYVEIINDAAKEMQADKEGDEVERIIKERLDRGLPIGSDEVAFDPTSLEEIMT